MLVGDRPIDPEFRSALLTALTMEPDVVDLVQLKAKIGSRLDPAFVAALGAAQIAKDFRDAPKPIGCSENDECKEIRKVVDKSLTRDSARSEAKDEL